MQQHLQSGHPELAPAIRQPGPHTGLQSSQDQQADAAREIQDLFAEEFEVGRVDELEGFCDGDIGALQLGTQDDCLDALVRQRLEYLNLRIIKELCTTRLACRLLAGTK